MTKEEAQAQAFYEGAKAANAKVPTQDNPYKARALFDEDQLAEHWYNGHKHARERARGKVGRARLRSASHYAY